MSDEVEELPEIDEAVAGEAEKPAEEVIDGSDSGPPDLGLIMEVPLRLSVELGSANLPVRDVLSLAKGSVVELDRMNGEPADVYVNDRLIARGEISTDDDRMAIRITELIAVKAAAGAA